MHRSKDTAANTLPTLIFGTDKGGPLGAEAAKRVQTHLGSVDAAEIVLEAERSTPETAITSSSVSPKHAPPARPRRACQTVALNTAIAASIASAMSGQGVLSPFRFRSHS
jgi:hypothetical protein